MSNWVAGAKEAEARRRNCETDGSSAALIEAHRRRFHNESWVFSQQDLVTDPLTSHDLVLCRHTLFHLKLSDIRRVLANFVASGSRYLLMTQQEQTCKLCWTMSNLPP